MSPKSAFISLATVSTLAATCGNCLRAIIQNSKNTSVTSEILALSNEVSDLQAVLGEVEAHRQTCSDSTGSAAQAEEPDALTPHLLKRAHSRLLQLENLVLGSIKLGRHNEIVIQRTAWLRKRRSYAAIIQDLREIKQNIILIATSQTL